MNVERGGKLIDDSDDDNNLDNYFQDAETKFRKEESMIAKMEMDDIKRKLEESMLEIESLKFHLASREHVFSEMKLRLEQAEADAKFVNAMNAKHLLTIQKTLSFVNDAMGMNHTQQQEHRLPSLLDLVSPSTVGDDESSFYSDCTDIGDENFHYHNYNSNNMMTKKDDTNRNQMKHCHVQVPPRALFHDLLDEVLLKETTSAPQTSCYEDDDRHSLRVTTSYAMKYLRRSPIVSSLVTPFKSDDSHCTSTTVSTSSFDS